MKTMQDFADRQLSKRQMNEVKGGLVSIGCTIRDQKGNLVEMLRAVHGETLDEAMNNLVASLGENNAFICKMWVA